jgi:hypothetical protein
LKRFATPSWRRRRDGALDLPAALTRAMNLSIGCCCCEDEVCLRLCASQTTEAPQRELRIAAAATGDPVIITDGQDFVPRKSRLRTYIPFVNAPQSEGNIP